MRGQRVVDVGEHAADRAPRGARHRGERAHRRDAGRGHAVSRESRPPRRWRRTRRRAPRAAAGIAEPALGPPPQHVVGGARPFLAHEIVDLGRGQAVAEILAEIGRSSSRRPAPSARSEPCRRARPRTSVRGQRRVAALQLGDPRGDAAGRQIAAGQHRAVGPRGLHRGEERLQLVERVLGELAIGRELAAEDRQHRCARRAVAGVELQHVVARDRRRVGLRRRRRAAARR